MKRLVQVAGLWCLWLLLGTGGALAAPGQADAPPVDARIEIVWPHDEQGDAAPVATAPLVNVEVYLFERSTLNPFPCDFAPRVVLRWAFSWTSGRPPYGGITPSGHTLEHDILERPIPEGVVGQQSVREVDGKVFPVWTFNNVPVVRLADRSVKMFYFVEVEGMDTRTNVWAHAEDPRTFLPGALVPLAVTGSDLEVFDAMIQVVYPHDTQGRLQPVEQAPLVNIGVDLFQHPVAQIFSAGSPPPTAVGYGRNRSVWLLRSLNDGFLERVKQADANIGEKRAEPRLDWSRWVFNDVDVARASDRANKYYFAVQVEGVTTHTTIWAHGADSRTHFPHRDMPAQSGPHCP